ncbi:serine hydrolase domain-containing protein [Spirosoma fluminis]
MKRSLTFISGLALTACLLLTTTSCDKPLDVQPLDSTSGARLGDIGDISAHGFDPAVMKTKIDAYMNAQNVSGYAYTIFVNGKRVATAEGRGGVARKSVDYLESQAIAHSPWIRQEVASCSKYITTLAVVRMLDRAGVSLDTSIRSYLPSFMTPSPKSKTITFRQLLSHHSGLVSDTDDLNITLADMILAVQTDNSTLHDSYQYNNMNFALCRLLLPYVYWKQVLKLSTQTLKNKEANQTNLDTELATVFLNFVRNDVFKPAGISDWNQIGAVDAGNNSPTLYYSNNVMGFSGVSISVLNENRNLGSVGFDLNAIELAQITSAARDYKIVSQPLMNAIRTGYKSRPLGFNDSRKGKYGEYYYKYGGANWNSNGKSGGLATMLVDFDCSAANVQVAVVANQNKSSVSDINWIQTAFESAWK